ncbi:hypothetical protein ACOMHN_024504 [Nucella lapillus]
MLEHGLKMTEKVLKPYIRQAFDIDEMQCGFVGQRSTIDAIFVIRQLQEKFREKHKDIYFLFVDLEKAFDRIPVKSSGGHCVSLEWMSGSPNAFKPCIKVQFIRQHRRRKMRKLQRQRRGTSRFNS